MTDLSKEDAANGWTVESLEAYRRERDKVADIMPGNIVTEYKRGRSAIQIEGAGRAYSPLKRRYQ